MNKEELEHRVLALVKHIRDLERDDGRISGLLLNEANALEWLIRAKHGVEHE